MKAFLILALLGSCLRGQDAVGGKYSQGGFKSSGGGGGGGGGSNVTISNHGVTNPPSSCSNGATTCAQSGADTKAVVGATGDTLMIELVSAGNSNQDAMYGACTVTATDGTHSFTYLPAAYTPGVLVNSDAIWTFYLKNATAGSYYISFTITGGSGCAFYYTDGIYWQDLSVASVTAPIDTSVTNVNTNTGISSVTSAGNVTNTGEVGLCLIAASGVPSFTGSFSALDSSSGGGAFAAVGSVTNPTAGASLTCSISVARTGGFSIIAITH